MIREGKHGQALLVRATSERITDNGEPALTGSLAENGKDAIGKVKELWYSEII